MLTLLMKEFIELTDIKDVKHFVHFNQILRIDSQDEGKHTLIKTVDGTMKTTMPYAAIVKWLERLEME